ncbi:restriction endonuclease subunit S [Nitrospirales bacterium NOB]|nr:restriction endonuclease subunit S [Nitrospirales bacterium NOB]
MAEFKHLDIEGLPEGWEAAHFGELVNYALGRTPPRNEAVYWKDGTYPWVSISDMEPYGTVTSTSEKVTALAFEKVFRGQLVPEGSLLMSFKLTIGRIARLGMPALHNEAIISFRPQHKKVNEDYLAYYLSQINYADYQDKAIKGHTLNKGKIDALEIALPPVAEQQRIAQVLSTVQAAIEQQERLIRTTTELKQALMQKLFTEGLRGEAQKETEIGLVPESWEVVSLDDVMSCHDGKRKPVTQSDRIPGPYPYYGASGVTDHVEGYLFDGDYLLIAEDGENLASRKLPIAFIARGKFWVNNHAHVLSMKRGNLDFYEQYIAQMEIKDYLSGTTRPKLNKGLMMTIKLPWPSVSEQNEIATALSACDTKLHTAERKRNALQDLFRTLLHELMTGKVRVV